MAKSKKPRSKPARSTEPTVSQQRQAYYEARARRTALEELGVTIEDTPKPAPDTKASLEALDSFDRLMVLYGLCRWTALAGQPPEPEDWEGDKDWPQPEAVEALFGNWDAALEEAGVLDSGVAALLDRVAKAHLEMQQRAEELERRTRKLEEDARKIPELERQMEGHKARRDAADLRVNEVEGERERLPPQARPWARSAGRCGAPAGQRGLGLGRAPGGRAGERRVRGGGGGRDRLSGRRTTAARAGGGAR